MNFRFDKNFLIILTLATFVRLYEFFNVYIISRDSPLYLYQAMVIYSGKLNLLELCGYSSRIKEINLFSLTIIPFYYVFKDWEIAGKFVSFLSNIISLVLLYYILSRYFKGFPLYLTLLIYSLIPTIIEESAEIMRESFYTFLVLCGLTLFLKGIEKSSKNKIFLFFLANLFWILSSWVRVEGIFLIALSWLYLFIKIILYKNKKEAIYTFISFSIIPIIVISFSIFYITFYKEFMITEIKGKLILLNPFTQPFAQTLKNFKYLDIPMPTPYFWDLVKQNLWLIAFGTTFFINLSLLYIFLILYF